MCVDYKQLNKSTVKDKFPIPVVEELIDELSGSKFFTNQSRDSYLSHLRQVLSVLKTNSLFFERSKCVFATISVEYLGHIISSKEVATDPSKIQAMKEWPVPKNIKQLRGFLRTGYWGSITTGRVVTDMTKVDKIEAKRTKPDTGMKRVQEIKAEG
uniref:Reverse transcriptase n=1 Tax=Tanacetum cinerariifolium TaxID=118510 RepID=A0A6L2L2K7_TANCI|nr:reverse transcriptase [Tanacetum cinerariifolium]